MSRYTGRRLKIMRAPGTELPGLSRKPIDNGRILPASTGKKTTANRSSGKL